MAEPEDDDDLEDCWSLVRGREKDEGADLQESWSLLRGGKRGPRSLDVTREMGHLEDQLRASLGVIREQGTTVAKPWDEDAIEDEDAIDALWAQTRAEDFSYAIFDESPEFPGWGAVYITPTAYLTEHGCMYDQDLMIEHLLPPELGEAQEMEGTYSFQAGQENEVRAALRARGFESSATLYNVINRRRGTS